MFRKWGSEIDGQKQADLAQDKPAKPATERVATIEPKGGESLVKQGSRTPATPANVSIQKMSEGLTLTKGQKVKLDELAKQFNPRMSVVMQRQDVLTSEQTKAREDAIKTARVAGKKSQDIQDAIYTAVQLTNEQKTTQADARKEMADLNKQLSEQVMSVLTPEQLEQLKKLWQEKK